MFGKDRIKLASGVILGGQDRLQIYLAKVTQLSLFANILYSQTVLIKPGFMYEDGATASRHI